MAITLTSPRSTRIAFVASVALDVLNAMYFTALADGLEGVGAWPAQTRGRMDAALRAEIDLLFSYPLGEPGVMGALNDALFFHPDAWGEIEALMRFIRDLPAAGSPDPASPGIQGLALYALRWPGHNEPYALPAGVSPREALAARLAEGTPADRADASPAGAADAPSVLALFDDPEAVRARMLHAVRRFYDEHYRPDEAQRMACAARSSQAHERDRYANVEELARRLMGRNASCLDSVCSGPYSEYIFVPSTDVGIYTSCIDYGGLHAIYYPCEAAFRGVPDADELTQRMALVYRALSDEQRLRILQVLRGGELYAQEIIERTGLHQSVVSRHLSFMKAVGLVNVRPQNNMKFYSLNDEAGEELRRAVDVFLPQSGAPAG